MLLSSEERDSWEHWQRSTTIAAGLARRGTIILLPAAGHSQFDTRSGKVYGPCDDRKRQREYMAFWEALDREIDERIRTIHLVCDHVRTHHGQEVPQGFANHPRLVMHFTPGHGSGMNQVELWCSILQRKRLSIVDFASKDHLDAKIRPFIHARKPQAHPFNWSTKSVAKVTAAAPALVA